MDLTLNEQIIYDFIVYYTKENLYPPSIMDICDGTGYKSKSTIFNLLKRLVDKGVIKVEPYTSRAIKLVGYKIVKEND